MALPPAATPAQWARTWMPEAPAWLLPACQSHTTPTIYTEATSISRHFLTPGESAILCHPDNQTQEVKQSEKTEEYLSKEEKRKISRKKKKPTEIEISHLLDNELKEMVIRMLTNL